MNTYPEDLFESIEFDLVKRAVAKFAVTQRAQERIEALKPSADFQTALADLHEVNELVGLYQSDFPVPALASEDIKPFLLRLKIQGATLEGEDFLIIKNTVESFNRVYHFFAQHRERTPSFQSKLAHVHPNKSVPDEIDRVLDRRGVVKTSASIELGKIRAALTKKRTAADRIFYRALKKYQTKGVLADINESVHENKRVMAIEGAYKGQVHGVFHGSSSKATIFYVEPAETLEINNEISILEDEERREVLRVLRMLTAFVAGYRDELRDYSTVLYQIDFVNAKAKYGLEEDACLPQLSEKPHIHLIKAINPVLRQFNASKGKGVVPLDLKLDTHTRILVISGPNAGGKSITLKTVGLLQLMIQSGLLVPVHPDSTMGWFNGIMADIGDAQSIENELSTYSSKLAKMDHFLKASYHKTLVLIDEFGSGSDPDLGSSMAQVFLTELNASKTFGVMTTHYNSIKALAGELPRVENGSMQFNSTDLSPEYVLNQGIPGSSYTYEVAQKVGISPALIDKARQVLDERTVAVDKLLVGIQREKNLLAEQRALLSDRLAQLESLRAKQERKIATLEDKVTRQSAINQEQNAMITWGKKFQGLVNEYAQARTKKDKDQVLSRFKVHAGERASQTQDERDQKKTKYQKQKEKKIQELTSQPAQIGDRVKLIGSRQPGEIIEIKKDQYLLSIGSLSTWVTRDKFIPAESLHGDQGTPKGKAKGGVRDNSPSTTPAPSAPTAPEQPLSKEEVRAIKKRAKKGQFDPPRNTTDTISGQSSPGKAATGKLASGQNSDQGASGKANSKKATSERPASEKPSSDKAASGKVVSNAVQPSGKHPAYVVNRESGTNKPLNPTDAAKSNAAQPEAVPGSNLEKPTPPAKRKNRRRRKPQTSPEEALKTAKEKLQEVESAPKLVQPPVKKSTGKPKETLSEERQKMLQPVRKVSSPATKEQQAKETPREATDADLKMLQDFFKKK